MSKTSLKFRIEDVFGIWFDDELAALAALAALLALHSDTILVIFGINSN
jgi:hypothetical protein